MYKLYKALLESIERRDVNAARDLIASGAPIDPPWWIRIIMVGARPPLVLASMVGAMDIATLLLDGGADPNGSQGWRSIPLYAASRAGDVNLVKLLIERGAEVNGRSRGGSSALQEASYRGHIGVVRTLLHHGADPDLVLSGDIGSLIRVRGPIIQMLLDAGGHASEELREMLHQGQLMN